MKTALVTGASRGLGEAIARELFKRDYYVIAPPRAMLDVSSGSSVSSYAPPIDSLDLLVNNAAIVDGSLYEVMETNAYGPYRLTRHLWPLLAKAKGRVVNIGSLEGEVRSDCFGHRPYSVSKATLSAISAMMSKNDDGVTVLECCMGWFRSRLGGDKAPQSAAEAAEYVIKTCLSPE